jgi:hypothetical protein
MKRLAVVFLATLAALVAAAPSAQAAPPTHQRVPIDETPFIDRSCGFPVQVQLTGIMLVIEWVDEDGTTRRFEGFPQAKATFTNLGSGETIKVPGGATGPRSPAWSPSSARRPRLADRVGPAPPPPAGRPDPRTGLPG